MYRIHRRLLAAITALGLIVGLAQPALAGTDIPNGVCDTTEACAYKGESRSGYIADFDGCESDWSCGISNFASWDYWNTSDSPDNDTESLSIRQTMFAYSIFTPGTFGGGANWCFPSGAQPNFLAAPNMFSSMWNSNTNYC